MKHWNPEDEIAAAHPVRPIACALAKPRGWPRGATTGIVLVAIGCAIVGAGMYQLLGPRDVFAGDDAPIDWSALDRTDATAEN